MDAAAVCRKLARQLKISLEVKHPHGERVHLLPEAVPHSAMSARDIEALLEEKLGGPDRSLAPCRTRIRHLGEYVARISLRGGYTVPLKIEVLKR